MLEEDIILLLESNYALIKVDFKSLSDKLFYAWPETEIYKGDWLTFGLYQQRQLIQPNASLCKNTVKVLESIPNVVNAGFSVLKPNTHIKAHVGYTNKVFRYHLGITIPSTNVTECGLSFIYSPNMEEGKLTVDFINWNNGKCFKFDDTITHSAHNYTNEDRIVLIVDVLK